MKSSKPSVEPKGTLSTPVVLIMFNRPKLTKITLEAIRKVNPQQLFVVSDGPRIKYPDEKLLVDACRNLVDSIDWPCEVTKIYSSSNMGCRDRISSGLSEVFNLVDRAIILEDDCLPNESFFYFTQELLDKYASDPRVGLIGGTKLLDFSTGDSNSYFFSRHPQIWGWATWARVWKNYDVRVRDWPKMRKTPFLRENLVSKNAMENWKQNFNLVFWRKIDTWDYQLVFNLWKNRMLSIVPNSNLVTNLGFGESATHTLDESSPFAALPVDELRWPLSHPESVSVNEKADLLSESRLFQASRVVRMQFLIYHFAPRFVKKLAAFLRKQIKSRLNNSNLTTKA
jgi:hypothetical protein